MEKTAWNNVAIIVTRPAAVIDLQESAREGVNQVGRESPVTMVKIKNSITHTEHNFFTYIVKWQTYYNLFIIGHWFFFLLSTLTKFSYVTL